MITVQKLSKSEDTGMYRFLLTQEELALIYAFASNIRLGGDDPASEAAFSILTAFDELDGIDFFEKSEKIAIEGIIENDACEIISTCAFNKAGTLFEVWAPDDIKEDFDFEDDEAYKNIPW